MNYKKQGEDFLTETNTTLEVVEAVPQKSPLWTKEGEKHGINYSVTLKNDRHSYTFDFWGSVADKELLEKAQEVEEVQSAQTPLYFWVQEPFEPVKSTRPYEVKSHGQLITVPPSIHPSGVAYRVVSHMLFLLLCLRFTLIFVIKKCYLTC